MSRGKIKKFFQRLFCEHIDADLVKWYWTHKPSGNGPASIEAEYHCKYCGKTVYIDRVGQAAIEWEKVMGHYKEAT